MDFIEGIPRSQGCEIIFVAVDHLSKYSHFIPLNHPYTTSSVARVFMDNIFKLHGMPLSIVSDHDSVFTSTLWRELVNRCLKTYLRCSMGTRLSYWTCWLSLAEWWYNSSVHSTTWMSPSEALYGFPPPHLLSYVKGTTRLAAVDAHLRDRDLINKILKEHLEAAQQRMKRIADKHQTDRSFC